MTRRLNRREILLSAAGIGANLAAGALPAFEASPLACVLNREQLRGPYYISSEMLRRDLAEGQPGVPTALRIRLIDVQTCKPLVGAAVDVWHCDAAGLYSGFRSYDPDTAPVGIVQGRLPQTDQRTYLRGVQFSDRHGEVTFNTIFPGWYFGRATHFHLKIHVGAAIGTVMDSGRVCYTGQLFFPEEVAAAVDAVDPYVQHKLPRTRIEQDFVYTSSSGAGMVEFGALPRNSPHRLSGHVTLGVDAQATTNPPRGPSQGGVGPSIPP